MKCVIKEGKILRVSDDNAAEMVRLGGWKYINKMAWKQQERGEVAQRQRQRT